MGKEITRFFLWSLEERILAFDEEQASFEQQSESLQQGSKLSRLLNNQNQETSMDPSPLHISSRSQLPSQTHLQPNPTRSDSDGLPPLNNDKEDTNRHKTDSLLATTFSVRSASHVSDDHDSQIRQYLSPSSRQSEEEIFKDKKQASIRKLGKGFLQQTRRNNTRNRLTDITAYDCYSLDWKDVICMDE